MPLSQSSKHTLYTTLGLVLLGYAGAAIFYGHLGLDPFPTCPACPYVDARGSHIAKTIAGTVIFGTPNAVLFAGVGWLVIALCKLGKRALRTRRP